MVNEKETQHKLNSSWVVWYHNPIDNDWSLNSYKKIYELNTLEDFFRFQNSWDGNLPSIEKSMFFLMKKKDQIEYIYPLWEDKNNKEGGCWSFKIVSNCAKTIWFRLCLQLITENSTKRTQDLNTINGISFSPKKGFCIVKIWNTDCNNNDVSCLNPMIDTYLQFENVLYKTHDENIIKDKKKKEKIEKYKLNAKKYPYNRNDSYKKSFHRR